MTRIDFYQIESGEPATSFSCRLIDKIYHLGHRVYIHAEDRAQAEAMDELLWSFKPASFIPHCLLGVDEAPVHIGFADDPAHHEDVLINLSGIVPDFFSRFSRVAEVVPLDQNSREAARNNFRFYKDRGYPLEYHEMKKRNG